MTNTLQNTVNFTLPFIQYSPLFAGFGQEPAVSVASMIRTSLLNAGVGTWYWNRMNLNTPLTKGQQDYVLFAEDFGYIEKCTVTNDKGEIWELKDVHNISPLSASSEQQRPNAVAVEGGTAGLPAGGTIDTQAIGGSASAVAATSLSLASVAGEGMFLLSTTNQSGSLGTPSGWTPNFAGQSGIYVKASLGSETISQSITPNEPWASIAISFRMQTTGSLPLAVQNSVTSGFILAGTDVETLTNGTSAGSGILAFAQISTVGTAWTRFSATDDKGNKYFLVGLVNPGNSGGVCVAVLWAPNVAVGTKTVTLSFDGSGSGGVGIIEVSGIISSLQNSPVIRFQGVPEQNYTANIIYQKRPMSFGPWFISSVATAVSGVTTYTGSFDTGALPAGSTVNITGFTTSANNGSFPVIFCTPTALSVQSSGGATETALAFATNFDWSPVPDSFVDVYNNLFLSEALAMVDDARAQIYRARGVAAFLSKAQGLTETQKNAFVQQWMARNGESIANGMRTQQGMGARGQ